MYRKETKSDYVRRKSVPRAVDEIKYIADRYPLKHVHFSDDLFFIRNSYKWLEEFAEVYPKEVGLPWNCNIRYDSVNQHAADLLEKAEVLRRGGRPRVGQPGNPRDRHQEAVEERPHRRRRQAASREEASRS